MTVSLTQRFYNSNANPKILPRFRPVIQKYSSDGAAIFRRASTQSRKEISQGSSRWGHPRQPPRPLSPAYRRAAHVKLVTYQATDPTVDSQIIQLKDTGANAFLNMSTPKFAI
jgi:hypothetical protein